jgi:hypothetical protein
VNKTIFIISINDVYLLEEKEEEAKKAETVKKKNV